MTEGPLLPPDNSWARTERVGRRPSPRRRRRQVGRLLAVAFAFELAVALELALLAGAVWWALLGPVLSD